MFAKTLVLAAVSASAVSAYSFPSCWSTCFSKYDVSSEGCLCSAPLEDVVSNCISVGCSAANSTSASTQYASWLSSYCGQSTQSNSTSGGEKTVTDVTTQFTTICPVTATETSGGKTSVSVYTTTSTVVTSYQTSVAVQQAPTTWSSAVTSTIKTTLSSYSTYYATATSTVGSETSLVSAVTSSAVVVPTSYVTTMTPGKNTWTGTASVAPVSSGAAGVSSPAAPYPVGSSTTNAVGATGTGAAPSSTSKPYSGSASSVKVGAGVLGGVAAAVAMML